MKRSISILAFLSVIIFGCHTTDIKEPRPVDQVISRIGGTWKISTVEKAGVNQPEYVGAAILFSSSTSDDLVHYTSGNMPSGSPWAASGTLKLGNDINTDLVMVSPDTSMTYSVSETQLQISFVFDGAPWKFTFTKQTGGGSTPSV